MESGDYNFIQEDFLKLNLEKNKLFEYILRKEENLTFAGYLAVNIYLVSASDCLRLNLNKIILSNPATLHLDYLGSAGALSSFKELPISDLKYSRLIEISIEKQGITELHLCYFSRISGMFWKLPSIKQPNPQIPKSISHGKRAS